MQVAPSLFDAPGAQSAGRLNAVKPKQVGATMALDQPELAFACVSEFGYKVSCKAEHVPTQPLYDVGLQQSKVASVFCEAALAEGLLQQPAM